MKKLMMLMMAAIAMGAGATPVIGEFSARQRYPWNGKVDIGFTLSGVTAADGAPTLKVKCIDREKGITNVAQTVTGDTAFANGRHQVTWDMNAEGHTFVLTNALFVVSYEMLGGVQLWENGPYWAECNVGASKPEEYGYYFWWGDTVGYKRNAGNNGWVSVKDGSSFQFSDSNCPTCGKDNSSLQSLGFIDSTTNLVAAHDAATAHLGEPWRMPTLAEIDALISNCDTTWTTTNGVYGRLVTGRGDYSSKSIFLPAAGFGSGSNLYNAGSLGNYLSSSPYSDGSLGAWSIYFNSGYFGRDYYRNRFSGQSVRPLRGFAK